MLGQVKTINNVKQIVPLTADTGSGNPIGTILPLYKKSTPNGYLYCDGSTFDTTAYPGLYAYLGTNVLPDYREFALVGAEENTTDVYNATTNPDGTIHDHDVYAEGEAKDDQVMQHTHLAYQYLNVQGNQVAIKAGNVFNASNSYVEGSLPVINDDGIASNFRFGTVNRGKRKAVYFYIKATTGLDENQQDYVLNTLNNTLSQQRSYSTTEHLTGKKWIDGKPIYEKTIEVGTLPNHTVKLVPHNIANMSKLVSINGYASNGTIILPLPYTDLTNNGGIWLYINGVYLSIGTSFDSSDYTDAFATIEYTKTTD